MTVSDILSAFMARRTLQGMVVPFTKSATTAWGQAGQPFGRFCEALPLRYSV